MSRDSLTITDNRTGKTYEVPITDDTIRALDLRQIKVKADEFGMMSYDPAFNNTALCRSKITYIDGDAGEDGLLDGRQTLGSAGNLDEEVRTRGARVQLLRRRQGARGHPS